MAKYKSIVTTTAGLNLLAAAVAGGTIEFTAVKTGNGTYDGTESLTELTDLKSVQQSFGIGSVAKNGTEVKLRSVFSNEGVADGYSMTEIGLYAKDADDTEILYAVMIAEDGLADYLPPYAETPTSITMEMYLKLTESEESVTFTASVVSGTYVTMEDFEEHTHTVNEIEDFPEAMPPTEHKHSKSEITDFPEAMPPTEHKHSKSEITDFPTTMPPSEHSQAASTITAGTLGGAVVANASAVANLGTSQVRNIYAGTAEMVAGTTALSAGDIYVMLKV